MADLISRQDAINAAIEAADIWDGCYSPERERMITERLKKVPAAWPKIGEWVEDVAYYDEDGCPCIITRCNQCGEPNPVSNFCPNCGAKMEVNSDGKYNSSNSSESS